MLKEFSYGAVVYKIHEGEPLFLLVLSGRNERWGFPKGHVENGETELETASREIYEETGIRRVNFVDGFKHEEVYIIDGTLPETKGRIAEKHSVYFLAEAVSDGAVRYNDEIAGVKWVNADKAMQLLSFSGQKKALKDAYDKINISGGNK
ncbi:MAG: NUDIX domain-containing protein [Endomicrobia bacterium]|nr:NUDIX domain-containing protein [Endomicrobiia bacterium]